MEWRAGVVTGAKNIEVPGTHVGMGLKPETVQGILLELTAWPPLRCVARENIGMSRFALVLGGGGYAGTAFHAGVVTALARAGWDPAQAEIVIGTSAGATTAALLGAGFPAREYVSLVLEHRLSGQAQRVMAGIGRLKPVPRMPRPRLRPASPDLALRALRPSSGLPFGVFLAAAGPAGTVVVDEVSPGYGPQFDAWPDRPTWITAVDLQSGSRAVFGRTHRATLPEAVSASVAIPGYFAPVVIGGVPYVDGGAWSTHHADLLLAEDVEIVFISAPSSTPERLAADPAQWLRAPKRRQLYREVAALRSAGKQVVVIEPDRGLRDVIGINSLSLRRRKPVALATLAFAARVLAAAPLQNAAGGRASGASAPRP